MFNNMKESKFKSLIYIFNISFYFPIYTRVLMLQISTIKLWTLTLYTSYDFENITILEVT
jgi:hypothetical protein